MAEIRNLLEEKGLKEGADFLDRGLGWGARLSGYQDAFHDSRVNVGIELKEDIAPPPNYLKVDHHGEEAGKPASLEQVARLLGARLSRRQEMVAANDKGYIPAMEAMGATPEEIAEIRRQDRQAQGVTAEEERLAERAIRENLSVRNGVTVVQALSSKFSPIADRLYGKTDNRLVVFTDKELNYYGRHAERLATEVFGGLARQGKAYYGGGPDGYFGVGASELPPEKIKTMVDVIIGCVGKLNNGKT